MKQEIKLTIEHLVDNGYNVTLDFDPAMPDGEAFEALSKEEQVHTNIVGHLAVEILKLIEGDKV